MSLEKEVMFKTIDIANKSKIGNTLKFKGIEYYKNLCSKYPIISIEDGLDENDWKGWKELNMSIGTKCQIVADDLTVTNKLFLERALKHNAITRIPEVSRLEVAEKTIEKKK